MATILVFAPHNDDHALAMGGTMAKHYKAGDEIYTFIGSYGEMSHPHLKPEIIRKTRVKEAQRCDKVLGGSGRVQFLGLKENKFLEDFERKNFQSTLGKKIKKLKPNRVYIPAGNDTHPDHKAFSKLIETMIRTNTPKAELYAYYVYPNMHHLKVPRLHIDISEVYSKKLSAVHEFQSQIRVFTYAITNNLAYLYQMARNWLSGFVRGTRFVEVFYRL